MPLLLLDQLLYSDVPTYIQRRVWCEKSWTFFSIFLQKKPLTFILNFQRLRWFILTLHFKYVKVNQCYKKNKVIPSPEMLVSIFFVPDSICNSFSLSCEENCNVPKISTARNKVHWSQKLKRKKSVKSNDPSSAECSTLLAFLLGFLV